MTTDVDLPAVVTDVLALARASFLETGRIDMGELAVAASVNRSTLYRRYRGRDQLLGEVIWSLAEPSLQAAIREARGTGGARIADAVGRFAAMAIGNDAFADFLRREPERALRVVTTRTGGVAARIVAVFEELVLTEVQAGRLVLGLSAHDTAYILLRIAESYVYTDAITGAPPQPAKVRQACGMLLGVAPESGVHK